MIQSNKEAKLFVTSGRPVEACHSELVEEVVTLSLSKSGMRPILRQAQDDNLFKPFENSPQQPTTINQQPTLYFERIHYLRTFAII